jgi:hypothetical protein
MKNEWSMLLLCFCMWTVRTYVDSNDLTTTNTTLWLDRQNESWILKLKRPKEFSSYLYSTVEENKPLLSVSTAPPETHVAIVIYVYVGMRASNFCRPPAPRATRTHPSILTCSGNLNITPYLITSVIMLLTLFLLAAHSNLKRCPNPFLLGSGQKWYPTYQVGRARSAYCRIL